MRAAGLFVCALTVGAVPVREPGTRSLIMNSGSGPGPNGLAPTPPLGWMAWEFFRCETDCDAHPNSCVNEALMMSMTDTLVAGGYAAAGYNQISIDDCWMSRERDADGRLAPNATRFPSGLTALANYMHSRGVRFGLYSDIGTFTCEGYPGDEFSEALDAQTFADWGVDYIKVDGCNGSPTVFESGYPEFGAALQASGRDIVFSCSWPAYLNSNETTKPFPALLDAGCNLWRNYVPDVENTWASVAGIIEHFGTYSRYLQQWAGPGHWHDMDMIVAGSTHNNLLTPDQAKVQIAIWSIMASPLFLTADLRHIDPVYREIILNPEVLAVNQDPLGKAGIRVTVTGTVQLWLRELYDGCVAVAMYNQGTSEIQAAVPLPPPESNLKGIAFRVRDLYERRDLGTQSGLYTTSVPATGVVVLKVCSAE